MCFPECVPRKVDQVPMGNLGPRFGKAQGTLKWVLKKLHETHAQRRAYTADIQLIYSWYTADIQLDWCSKVERCLDSLLILMPKLKPGAHAPSITNHALSLEHAAWQISLCLAKKKRLYALWAVPKAWVGWWLNGLWNQNIFGIIITH